MAEQREFSILAQELIQDTKERQYGNPYPFIEIEGVRVTHPYLFVETETGFGFSYSKEVLDCYHAGNAILNPANTPSHWIDFLKEVDILRKANGCNCPVDLIWGAYFLTLENPRAVELGIPKFEVIKESGTVDIRDVEKVKGIINAILADDELKGELKNILGRLLPDVGYGGLDKDQITSLLDHLGIKKGVLLDLGCGIGESTTLWKQKTGLKAIGLDRQYHRPWHAKFWEKKEDGLAFVRANFMDGIPLADNSIDVVIMGDLVENITEEALEQALIQTKRILKPETGMLVVGPLFSKKDESFRIFRKERAENGQYLLVEHFVRL